MLKSLQYSGMQYKMLKSKLEREHPIPPDTIALYRPASESPEGLGASAQHRHN